MFNNKLIIACLALCFANLAWSSKTEEFEEFRLSNPTIRYGDYEIIHEDAGNKDCEIKLENPDLFINASQRKVACDYLKVKFNLPILDTDEKCYEHLGRTSRFIRHNPCYLRCPKKSYIVKGEDSECYFKTEDFLFTGMKCGEKHSCDEFGCCVEDKLPEIETTTPRSQNPDYENDIKSALTQAESLLKELKEIAFYKYSRETFQCKRPGKYARKNQLKLSKNYFDCRWISTVHRCPTGETFNDQQKKCIKKHDVDEGKSELKIWSNLIKCKEEGVFKSQFDCHYFYQCSPKHEHSSGDKFTIEFTKCPNHLVFNDEKKRCDHAHETECKNVPIPGHNRHLEHHKNH